MFGERHAGEDAEDVRVAGRVAERPCGVAGVGVGLAENFSRFGGERGERAAAQRFHDDDRNAGFRQNFVLFAGTVEFPVEVVELNLREIPFLRIDDGLECFRSVVEGETELADLSLFFHLLEKFASMEFFREFPVRLVEGVEHVEVEVIGLAAGELFLEDAFDVGFLFCEPDGHFVREIVGVTGIGFEEFAETFFAFAAVVHVGGVEVVASGEHGAVDHLFDGGIINRGIVGGDAGQSHASEPEKGYGECGVFPAAARDLRAGS